MSIQSGSPGGGEWFVHKQDDLIKYWNKRKVQDTPKLEAPTKSERYTVDPTSCTITDSKTDQRFALDDITYDGVTYTKSDLRSMPVAGRRELLQHVAMYFEFGGVDLTDVTTAKGSEQFIEVERGAGDSPGKHRYEVQHEVPADLKDFLHEHYTSHHEWLEINKIISKLALDTLGFDRKGKGRADHSLGDDDSSGESALSVGPSESEDEPAPFEPLDRADGHLPLGADDLSLGRDVMGLRLRRAEPSGDPGPSGSGQMSETGRAVAAERDFAAGGAERVARARDDRAGRLSGLEVEATEVTDEATLRDLQRRHALRLAADPPLDDSSSSSAYGFDLLIPTPPVDVPPPDELARAARSPSLREREIIEPQRGSTGGSTLAGLKEEIDELRDIPLQVDLVLQYAEAISTPTGAVEIDVQTAFWHSIPWEVLAATIDRMEARPTDIPYLNDIRTSMKNAGALALQNMAEKRARKLASDTRRERRVQLERQIRTDAEQDSGVVEGTLRNELCDAVGLERGTNPRTLTKDQIKQIFDDMAAWQEGNPSPFNPETEADKKKLLNLLYTLYRQQNARNRFRLEDDETYGKKTRPFWNAVGELRTEAGGIVKLINAAEALRNFCRETHRSDDADTVADPYLPQRVLKDQVGVEAPLLVLADAIWLTDDNAATQAERALVQLHQLARTVELASTKLGQGNYKYGYTDKRGLYVKQRGRSDPRTDASVGSSPEAKAAANEILLVFRDAIDNGISHVNLTSASIGYLPTDDPVEIGIGSVFKKVFDSSSEWWKAVMRNDEEIAANFRNIWLRTGYGGWLAQHAALAEALPGEVRDAMREEAPRLAESYSPAQATSRLNKALESADCARVLGPSLDLGQDPLEIVRAFPGGAAEEPITVSQAFGDQPAVHTTALEIVETLNADWIVRGVLNRFGGIKGSITDEVVIPALKAVIRRYPPTEHTTKQAMLDELSKSFSEIDWSVVQTGFDALGAPPPITA